MSATSIGGSSPNAASTAPTTVNTSSTRTEVVEAQPPQPDAPTLRLQLHRSTPDKKVSWNSATVDNENMGRKKSKCCCIYKKPRAFGESSSESEDDECDNCFGHVEKRKKKGHQHNDHTQEEPDGAGSSSNPNEDFDKTSDPMESPNILPEIE